MLDCTGTAWAFKSAEESTYRCVHTMPGYATCNNMHVTYTNDLANKVAWPGYAWQNPA